ncbi:hypothetical protein GQ54DRAFT_283343 [Martensiomyces pterosporus]|nr:hypothetical protein GQ54DRAFT_283343 [Martensiomyces pterosporus]
MSATTLEFYWDLASLDEGKRIDAATKLIATLCEFQAQMPESQEVAKTATDLDRICASDVAYAVKRLIRGLTSPRDGARQGFSMALAELISRIPCISVRVILEILMNHTKGKKSMNGQEERDMWFGRVFGLMALIQSGIITRASTTQSEIDKIITELTDIAAKKSYLRELAYVTMSHMVPVIGDFSFSIEIIGKFVEVALNNGSIQTPDELYLAMLLRRAHPQYNWGAAFPGWRGLHFFDARNLSSLKAILCESSSEDTALFSTWHPQLHIVWDEIIDMYFSKERATELQRLKPAEFPALWDSVVEMGLFSGGASQFKRYWGYLLIERLLPHLQEASVPVLMTPNVVRGLSEVSMKKSTPLSKVAMRTAEKLVSISEESSAVGLAILTHLLSHNKAVQESGTKSLNLGATIANRIVTKLDEKDIAGYIRYVQQVFLTPELAHNFTGATDSNTAHALSSKSVDMQRAWAIDQMIRVARFGQLPISDDLTADVLNFITVHASCHVVKIAGKKVLPECPSPPKPQVSHSTRVHCATSLVNLVGDLNRHSSSSGKDENGRLWAASAVSKMLEFAAKKDVLSVVLPGFDEVEPVLRAAEETLKAAAKGVANFASRDIATALRFRGFELFLANISLMAAVSPSAEERAEFLEAIPEARECFDRMALQLSGSAKSAKKRSTRSSAKAEEEEGEPKPVEVLTDILISLLTKSSNTLRKVCEQVFVFFSDMLTSEALDSIIGVLQAKEGVTGDEDGQVETEMEIPDDLVDDEETGADGAEDGFGDVDMEQIEAVDEELRRKIEEALGEGAVLDDAEVSASGEEEVYDDEQMKVFDDKLAEIFHIKKQQKLEARNLKISFVDFKLRVLDLANVFLTKQPESPLVMKLLPVIIDLAKTTNKDSRSKPIYNRTMSILNTKRLRCPTGFKTADGLELLRAVHERAQRSADKNELNMLTNVATFLVKAVLGNSDGTASSKKKALSVSKEVAQMYELTLKDFMTRKTSQIHVEFFTTVARRLRPSQLEFMWRLATKAVSEYGHPLKAVNVYRQVQVFTLAGAIAATASQVSDESADLDDASLFVALSKELLAAMRSAVKDTLVFAVSDKNTNAATGKLTLDSARLREILSACVAMTRKLLKTQEFASTAKDFLEQTDPEWASAVEAISASTVYTSLAIKKACDRLSSAEEFASKAGTQKRKRGSTADAGAESEAEE